MFPPDRPSAAPTRSTAVLQDSPATCSLEAALSRTGWAGTLCSGTERKTLSEVDFNKERLLSSATYSSCCLRMIRACPSSRKCIYSFSTPEYLTWRFGARQEKKKKKCTLHSSVILKKKKHSGEGIISTCVQQESFIASGRKYLIIITLVEISLWLNNQEGLHRPAVCLKDNIGIILYFYELSKNSVKRPKPTMNNQSTCKIFWFLCLSVLLNPKARGKNMKILKK